MKAGCEELFYWTSNYEAEVDFVISTNENTIVPVEVKSGMSKQKKSLKVYEEKYNPEMMIRLSPRNFVKDGKFINIPLYSVSLLLKV